MKSTTAILGFGFLCTTFMSAAQAAEPIEATMQSQVLVHGEGAALRARLTNRNFSIVDFATDETPRVVRTLLLSQTIDRVLIGDELMRESSRIEIGAQALEHGNLGPLLFRIKERGDEGRAHGAHYVVSRYGCCATGPAFIVYSLETGELVLRHSLTAAGERWLTMLVKGEPMKERVVAAYLAESAADAEELGSDKRRVMSLTYAQPGKALQRVFLRLPRDVDRAIALNWSPELSWVDARHPEGTDHLVLDSASAPADAATDVMLRVSLDDDLEIMIPLVRDRLDLRNAQLPSGFALEAAPLP